jgi:glycosyltransferase involved in cell wall biosynthesis
VDSRPRILLLSDRWPIPPNAGDRQRVSLMLDALAAFADVDLMLLTRDPTDDPRLEQLRPRCNPMIVHSLPRGKRGPWKLLRPLATRAVDRLAHNFGSKRTDYSPDPVVEQHFLAAHRSRPYDAVVSKYLYLLARSGTLGRVPVVHDVDDLDTEIYRSRLRATPRGSWKRPILRLHLSRLERVVPGLLARCGHLWVCSPEDGAIIRHPSISVLPNIPFNQPADPPPIDVRSRTLLIVASWTHRVNVEGVGRFLSESWPLVRQRIPDASLRLVGAAMSDVLRSRWGAVPGVVPVGPVESLDPEYAAAAACAVPLHEGGGSKIKVLEAFAYRRPVVVTSHGLRGYAHLLKDGESVLLADDPRRFADACTDLLLDQGKRTAMAERGHAVIRAHFSRQAFNHAVREGLSRVLPGSP